MERKFESDLARRVTSPETSRRFRKTVVVMAAVAVCAMLSVSALYSVAMSGNSGAPIVEIDIFSAKKAYLTETDTGEYGNQVENLLAVRTMNLKVRGDHLFAGEDCPLHYAKFVYGLNVSISEDDASWEGRALGELKLPGIVGDVTPVATATVTRADGSSVEIDTEVVYASAVGSIITVNIPTLELVDGDTVAYAAGDSISISVMIQTGVDLSDYVVGETVYETAWGDSLTPTDVEEVIAVLT